MGCRSLFRCDLIKIYRIYILNASFVYNPFLVLASFIIRITCNAKFVTVLNRPFVKTPAQIQYVSNINTKIFVNYNKYINKSVYNFPLYVNNQCKMINDEDL